VLCKYLAFCNLLKNPVDFNIFSKFDIVYFKNHWKYLQTFCQWSSAINLLFCCTKYMSVFIVECSIVNFGWCALVRYFSLFAWQPYILIRKSYKLVCLTNPLFIVRAVPGKKAAGVELKSIKIRWVGVFPGISIWSVP